MLHIKWAVLVVAALLGLYSLGGAIASYVSARVVASIGVAPPPSVDVGGAKSSRVVRRESYDKLVSANPFDIDVRIEAPAPVPVSKAVSLESEIEESSLPATLIGTLAGGDEISLCIVQDTRNRQTHVYQVGEKLLEMATIVRIERQRVIVERNGKVEELLISEEDEQPGNKKGRGRRGKPTSVKPARKTATKLDVVERGENEFVLDKEQFNDMLNDLGPLLSSARVVPNFQDGKIDGYKIFAIRKDSVYEKIGLQNGDIIDSINGLSIETPDKALTMFQQMKSEEHFDLEIRRDDSPMNFSYDLE